MKFYEIEEPSPDNPQTITINNPQKITIGYNKDAYDTYYSGIWTTNSTNENCCEEKRKEEKNMGEQFLKIKKEQELKKLEEDMYNKIKEIKETDPIVKVMKETEKNIMVIAEDKTWHYFPTYDYYTKETSKKIDEIHKKHSEKEDKIVAKYKEIEALCDGASWEERMKIYKIYGIVED